jgi:hypothetical protein
MRSAVRQLLRSAPLLLAVFGAVLSAPSRSGAVERVILVPDERASWRPSNIFAWLRAGHNYGDRSITVETSPPGATLDLFYIRANFQKRYEQAEAPAEIVLPPRVQAGPRDAVMIRAFLEGYRQREVSIRVSSKQDRVMLELEALPNSLVAVSHTYFAGRGSLAFLTKETLRVRVQERKGGFNVILAETAKGKGVELDQFQSALVPKVRALQLGEDLLVEVSTREEADGGLELRSRQSMDELRNLHVYSVELVPGDGGVAAVHRARSALAEINASAVSGCAARFDENLRAALDPADLSRALAPRGAFTDPYLRAAMKRLGEVSPGRVVSMIDGSQYRTSSPIELAAAMSQPGEALGYLALLRALVARLEVEAYREGTLRGLIAPEVGAEFFSTMMLEAQGAERSCRGGALSSL